MGDPFPNSGLRGRKKRSSDRVPGVSREGRSSLPQWWPLPAAVVFLLSSWELVARAGWISALFFPPPTVILDSVVELTRNGDLIEHSAATLSRVGVALALGGVPGLLLGWVMGWSRRARSVGNPLVAAFHPMPKVALYPLILIIFGIGEISKVIAVSIGVFFPLLINAMTGVRQISPIHFEVARNVGVRPLRMLVRVVIPGSLPVVMAGVRLAVNVGLLITIAIELVSPVRGIGALMWYGWETLRTARIYAGLFVLIVVGVSMNAIVQVLTRRLVPWRVEPEV